MGPEQRKDPPAFRTEHASEELSSEPGIPTVRRFFTMFKTEHGAEKAVAVQELGRLESLNFPAESEEMVQEAQKLIDIFSKAVIMTGGGNETIGRRPHFLICGGFVRDMLLGKTPKDIDFATNLSYDAAKETLATCGEELHIKETGSRFKVLRVRFPDTGHEYEIATFRQDGAYEDGRRPTEVTPVRNPGPDADRRDLTVNALFYNPRTGRIIDYVGGLDDIRQQKLRFVGNPEERLAEDHMRALRYVRFLLKTGFSEDAQAREAICAMAPKVATLAGESVYEEMTKTFASGASTAEALELYRSYGLLEHLLPEVAMLQKCEQGPPYHMEGDAFLHTKLVCAGLPSDASSDLIWAAIMHDVGKPATRQEIGTEEERRVSFLDHENVSVQLTRERLKALRLSNERITKILWIIAEHQRVFSFPTMREGKAAAFAASPHFEDLLMLMRADIGGSYPANPQVAAENTAIVERSFKRLEEFRKYQETHGSAEDEVMRAVNGNIVRQLYLKLAGIVPEGKVIGMLKSTVHENIRERHILDPDKQCLCWKT
jgi:poly(A) polymerase